MFPQLFGDLVKTKDQNQKLERQFVNMNNQIKNLKIKNSKLSAKVQDL